MDCKPPIHLGTSNILGQRSASPVDSPRHPWLITHQPPSGQQDDELKQSLC